MLIIFYFLQISLNRCDSNTRLQTRESKSIILTRDHWSNGFLELTTPMPQRGKYTSVVPVIAFYQQQPSPTRLSTATLFEVDRKTS